MARRSPVVAKAAPTNDRCRRLRPRPTAYRPQVSPSLQPHVPIPTPKMNLRSSPSTDPTDQAIGPNRLQWVDYEV